MEEEYTLGQIIDFTRESILKIRNKATEFIFGIIKEVF